MVLLHQTTAETEGSASSGDRAGHTFISPPDVGEYWDVFITTTNEPSHFVVVPLAKLNDLNSLTDDLHAEYKVKNYLYGRAACIT